MKIKRRDFISLSSKAALMASLPISVFPKVSDSGFKLGYQLFSIRDRMKVDPRATLKALKTMGYQDFEHFGFDAENNRYYGFEISEFKNLLSDLELTVSSGHYPFSPFLRKPEEELMRFLDKCIDGALKLDIKYLTWPWIEENERTQDGFKNAANMLNRIGEHVKKAGLGFAYHNHGYEFDALDNTSGYDIILKETDPSLVKLQMDMYWVMHSSKLSPRELIRRNPGRFVMWHIKDMHKVSRDYTELGNGSIDYHEILPDPNASGLEYYYIEQGGNFSKNSLASAKESAHYFKGNLQKYF